MVVMPKSSRISKYYSYPIYTRLPISYKEVGPSFVASSLQQKMYGLRFSHIMEQLYKFIDVFIEAIDGFG